MAIPIALVEGAGDKMLPLVYDLTGTNASAAWRGVVPRTINGSPLANVGVATHPDDSTWAANDPLVVMGGVDGTAIHKIAVDSGGRLILRPGGGVYDAGGGVNGYGQPVLVARSTVNGENYGWQGVATHQDGVAGWAGSQGVAVIAGYDGSTVKKLLSDAAGRARTFEDFTLAGTGHVNVVTPGTAVPLRSTPDTPFRRIQIIADWDNTATVFLGVLGVTADETATTGGFQLRAAQAIAWVGTGDTANLTKVYINSTAVGGVSFIYFT